MYAHTALMYAHTTLMYAHTTLMQHTEKVSGFSENGAKQSASKRGPRYQICSTFNRPYGHSSDGEVTVPKLLLVTQLQTTQT